MSNQITTLITLLEEEKSRLEKLIEIYVADNEYLLADYHWRAICQLNGRLQTLKTIHDPNYRDKMFELHRIKFLKQQIDRIDSDDMKEFFSRALAKSEETLRELEQAPPKQTSDDRTPVFDQLLVRLFEKKVKNLKLILSKKDNLSFGFSYSAKCLKVTFSYVKEHMKQRRIYEGDITRFEKLGFRITGDGTKLTLTIVGEREEIKNKLKLILSKIVFEVFHFENFVNESYIRYTEIPGR